MKMNSQAENTERKLVSLERYVVCGKAMHSRYILSCSLATHQEAIYMLRWIAIEHFALNKLKNPDSVVNVFEVWQLQKLICKDHIFPMFFNQPRPVFQQKGFGLVDIGTVYNN